jgi:hypothetical protein
MPRKSRLAPTRRTVPMLLVPFPSAPPRPYVHALTRDFSRLGSTRRFLPFDSLGAHNDIWHGVSVSRASGSLV